MNKLKALIAVSVILPFAAWAAGQQAPAASVVGVSAASTAAEMPAANGTAYNCCWVWMNGWWWCVPC